MKLKYIQEPELEFAQDKHICPRAGISTFDTYESKNDYRKKEINVGGVGTSDNLGKLSDWIDKCSRFIPQKADNNHPRLYAAFSGFNLSSGFKSNLQYGEALTKDINNSDIKRIIKIANDNERITEAIDLYYEKVKFVAQHRNVDLITCVIPAELFPYIAKEPKTDQEETIEGNEEEPSDYELNFRRALKAKTMHLGKPLQLVREQSLSPSRFQQDEATKAWNFSTAAYYKANQIPWRLPHNINRPSVCFVGISFYKSRDKKVTHTSLAQIFDELGNGVILRGTPVKIDERDRKPHLESEQAFELLKGALSEYNLAMETFPARLVIHKSSNYNEDELDGFRNAVYEMGIGKVDFVTILDSNVRMLRDGMYPALRGTHIELDKNIRLLYTKGSVEYYRTYPGPYIPQPLEVRVVESDVSPDIICEEILALTKMNWNNTQFDGKYPITMVCARKVGEVMKYLDIHEKAQIKYGFYM
ncbi:hypothetical protein F5984_23770 [Rudanella paleaurantiibacter]|uniref:Piwi domain-containing protein n=1 Tax=Rudanella paleaurantiibacter TaxID=2614655 RepID=A0A7J5TSZ5_9BACT|nr:hypothetical protein [Rudanella paleaurantiibacter]KAB7726649.1 hypothetical protein F5984_23770 [Rudanella paleaurantiibacter]